MSEVTYRVPGFPSHKSNDYLDALLKAGWAKETVDSMRGEIPRFESASIRDDFETACLVFVRPWDEAHFPFLRELNIHIKILSRAVRTEELQRKASSAKDKDSIAASALLNQMEAGTGVVEGKATVANNGVTLTVNIPKMSKEKAIN